MCQKIDIFPEDISSGNWVNKFQSLLENTGSAGYFELNPELYYMLSKAGTEEGCLVDYFMSPDYQEANIVQGPSCGCYGCMRDTSWKPLKNVVILGTYLSSLKAGYRYMATVRSDSSLDSGTVKFIS